MTTGQLIHWARFYDPVVQVLTLGHAGQLRQRTLDLAEITRADTVLDVGCGTGDLTLLAAKQAAKAAGIDGAPEMIAEAKRKAARAGIAVDFQTAYVEAIPFPDASFDAVLSSLMVHHLPGDLKDRAFAEAARVLKPGGRLVIADVVQNEHGGPFGHLWGLVHPPVHTAIDDLAARVQAAGFSGVETGGLGFGPVKYIRARRP